MVRISDPAELLPSDCNYCEDSSAGSSGPGRVSIGGVSEEPRWLDEDQQRTWRRFGALMQLLPVALEAPLQREADLSYFSYLVLAMLSEAPERTRRMSELAALSNASLSRLSHVVSRLERAGWVRRAPDREDRRVTAATLTEDGYRKVVAAAPVHVASVRELVVDRLSPDQLAQLDAICGALLAALPAEGRRTVFGTDAPPT